MENIQIFYGDPVIFLVACSKQKVAVATTEYTYLYVSWFLFIFKVAVMSITKFLD